MCCNNTYEKTLTQAWICGCEEDQEIERSAGRLLPGVLPEVRSQEWDLKPGGNSVPDSGEKNKTVWKGPKANESKVVNGMKNEI